MVGILDRSILVVRGLPGAIQRSCRWDGKPRVLGDVVGATWGGNLPVVMLSNFPLLDMGATLRNPCCKTEDGGNLGVSQARLRGQLGTPRLPDSFGSVAASEIRTKYMHHNK